MAVISLGYYIAQMRSGQHFPGVQEISGISLEECLGHVNDYRDFLRDRETFIRQFVGMANNYACLPLDTLVNGDADHAPITPEIYQSVADQIYAGIAPSYVGYPFPEPPAPVANPNDAGCFDRYVASLHEGDESPTRTSVEEIIGRMNELLADKTPINQRVAGTVVGRVQSGKTRNYVGLMLKAVEQGWNVIFILTSNSTALGQQTVDRIEYDIRNRAGVDNDISLNSENALGALQICRNNQAAGNIRQGGFFWGVAIKEVTHLRDIKNWLDANRQFVPEMRILIIDDEADAASPDGQRPEGVWNETETESRLDQIGDIPEDADAELQRQRETITGWFRSLYDIELNDDELQTIQAVLRGGSARTIQARFLADPDIRGLLSLNDDTISALSDFFNERAQGRAGADANIRSHSAFIRFIRSILAVASGKTAINRALREIIDRADNAVEFTFPFARCAYIGYTATFYACILNRRPEDTPLYPEFIYSLPKSDRYFGLEEIFGTDLKDDDERSRKDGPEEARMKIVTHLGDELAICQNLQYLQDNVQVVQQAPGLYIDHATLDFILSSTGKGNQLLIRRGTWTTLKEAIAWAFCTAAARRYYRRITEPNFQNQVEAEAFKRKNGDREHLFTSMLINVAANVTIHKDLKEMISQYLASQCAQANRDAFRLECETVWRKFALGDPQNRAYLSAEEFEELRGYQPEGYPAWGDLVNDLNWFIEVPAHRKVIQHNSTAAGRNDIQDYEDGGDSGDQNLVRYNNGDVLWFVCGGYTLSRGLTLPGLTSSYFTGINKTTPVDRLTQMGRWFGYRDHYELLPRLWMPSEAVEEYKKIAKIEQDAHVKIRETFMNRESPFDGANYLTLLFYGKKLSSRAFAVRIIDKKIGTERFPGDISLDQRDIEQISQQIRRFLRQWDDAGHRQDYANGAFEGNPTHPVWHISGEELQEFLNEIKQFYPENTERTLHALAAEIGRDESQAAWDVVWGGACEEQQTAHKPYPAWRDDWWTDVGDTTPKLGSNARIAVYSHAYRPTANFAMISPKDIWQVDARLYDSYRSVISANIREDIEKKRGRGAQTPFAAYENALGAGLNDGNLQDRLDHYLDDLANHPASMPGCIHHRLAGNKTYDGYRNRTSRDYLRQVYEQAHHGPTLQIYPVVLKDDVADQAGLPRNTLVYVISFFWPGHVPNNFLTAALADRVQVQIIEFEFQNAVKRILEDYGFLMSLRMLKNKLRHEFGDRWNDIVWNRFPTTDGGHGYRRFEGKIAYYAENWATGQVEAQALLIEAIRSRIVEILEGRGAGANRISGPDLIRELQQDDRFHDLLSIVTDPNFLYYDVLTEKFCEDHNIDMETDGRGTRKYRYQGA